MKKVLLLTTLGSALLFADAKLIDVEGASITYESSSNAKFGNIQMTSNGTEHLYIKDWGHTQLSDETTTQKGIMGTTKEHEMTLHQDNMLYSVDFQRKIIEKMSDPAIKPNENWRETLKRMGGKKVGSDRVAGYKCEEWELSQYGSKSCMYQGLMLRTTVKMAGTESTTVATKVDIGVPSAKHFKLPDYPVRDVMEEMYEEEERYNEPQTSTHTAHDTDNQPADMDEVNEKMGEFMQNMGALFGKQE